MSGDGPLHPDINAVFPIDPAMLAQIAPFVQSGSARARFQVTVTDLQTGEQRDMLLSWPFAEIDDLGLALFRALSGTEPSELDLYFWIYWQGWAGTLDASVLEKVPVGQNIVDKVARGEPLRGGDLDLLANGLGWHYANQQASFGDGAWKQGTLSAPHTKSRKVVKEHVEARMSALHGSDFREG